jgi:hypothetical protein
MAPYNNRSYGMNGPDRYAEQFSETDARIELTNWENELKTQGGSASAVENIQRFIDALRKRIAELTKKPETDHPTQELPPEPPKQTTAAAVMTGIGDTVLYPFQKATDAVEHGIGADIPLPAGAFHRDITEGPNPIAGFWDLIQKTHWTSPIAVIEALWNMTVEVFDWVIWDFKEFVRLVSAWNGSVWMLTGHPQYLFDVIWRSLMTGLIVVGAVMSGPLLMVMTEWTKMVVEVLLTMGRWIAEGVTYTARRLRR